MVNPVNHNDPFDQKLRARIDATADPAERLSWTLERYLRPGWDLFIRREVMAAGNPPAVSEVLDAVTQCFARMVSEAIQNASEGQPEAWKIREEARAFTTGTFEETLAKSLARWEASEIVDTIYRHNA